MPFSGFQDLDPAFAASLQQMFAAHPGISVNSGYRDVARQTMLWNRALAKYGSAAAARRWVAPPGHSMHNKRMAADLGYADPDAIAWAHANAAKYGLTFPLGNENWHIEPIGARGRGGVTPPRNVVMGATSAPPATATAMMFDKTPIAQTPGMTGTFQPAFGDVVAPQQVQSVPMQLPSLPNLGLAFLQQAEERRQREEDQAIARRQALFAPPTIALDSSSLAGLYG